MRKLRASMGWIGLKLLILLPLPVWPVRFLKRRTIPDQSWSDAALLTVLLGLFIAGLAFIPVAAAYTWTLWNDQTNTINNLIVQNQNAIAQGAAPNVSDKDLVQLSRDLSDTFVRSATATVQLAGAIVIGLGLYFTRRQVLTSEANLKHARETLDTTRQGQLNDRFGKAVEQLGNESITVRLGGIYALEGIARQSDDLYWPVMEVLTGFLREYARVPEGEPEDLLPDGEPRKRLPTDVQAIFTVLARRRKKFGPGVEDEHQRLDLSLTYWRNTDLTNLHLPKANFFASDFVGAYLFDVNLSGSFLRAANFTVAGLSSSDLSGSDLYFSSFFGAYLQGANLSDAQLFQAHFVEANLNSTILRDADLRGADFTNALNLTADQLRSAHTYGGAILPPELEAKLNGIPSDTAYSSVAEEGGPSLA